MLGSRSRDGQTSFHTRRMCHLSQIHIIYYTRRTGDPRYNNQPLGPLTHLVRTNLPLLRCVLLSVPLPWNHPVRVVYIVTNDQKKKNFKNYQGIRPKDKFGHTYMVIIRVIVKYMYIYLLMLYTL